MEKIKAGICTVASIYYEKTITLIELPKWPFSLVKNAETSAKHPILVSEEKKNTPPKREIPRSILTFKGGVCTALHSHPGLYNVNISYHIVEDFHQLFLSVTSCTVGSISHFSSFLTIVP